MSSRRGTAAALRAPVLALLLCAVGSAGAAQEVGIYATGASSQLPDLNNVSGFGAHILVFWPGIGARTSIYSQLNSQVRMARTCSVVRPPANCGDEEVTRETRLRGVSVAAALPVLSAGPLQVELGGGLSFNLLDAEDQAPSGRRTALMTEKSGQIGVLGSAAARLRPVPALPVVLYVLAARHQLRLTACGEYDWMDDPFCGGASLTELRAGIGYVIRH